MPLRVPLAQHSTTGAVVGISLSREPSSGSGMLTEPGALPPANSAAERTSTSVAPFFTSDGSKALTLRAFHHLYPNHSTRAMSGQYC